MTEENYLKKLADMQTQIKELVPDSLTENEERRIPRLIDADELMKAIADFPYGYRGMIESVIENQPTVDAVEVIRCKECKHWEKNDWNPNGMCRAFDDGSVCVLTETDKDEYCARAERKEE